MTLLVLGVINALSLHDYASLRHSVGLNPFVRAGFIPNVVLHQFIFYIGLYINTRTRDTSRWRSLSGSRVSRVSNAQGTSYLE